VVRGLVLAASGAAGFFEALELDSGTCVTGTTSDPARAAQLLLLAADVPIISDDQVAAAAVLERAGIRSRLAVWDVLELAGLLRPDAPNDRLERTAAALGVAPNYSSRAWLIATVFQALLDLLEEVDTQTLVHAKRLAAPLDWPLGTLLAELEHRRVRSMLESSGALASASPIGAWITLGARSRGAAEAPAVDPYPPPLDLDDVSARLAADSAIGQALADYEPRAEQVHMARMVADALNDGGQLIVEAGTGTGKGLAYLLPAAMYAVASQQRVVVSTATTTLQDQLCARDLPLVRLGLGNESCDELKVSVLKGRANYVCLQRWQMLLQSPELEIEDRTLLLKTLFWLPRTRTGDRAELRLTPREEEAWQRINAVAEACTPVRCQFHRIGVCFLARARRAAEESHIVITNHALLLSDLVTRSRVLPDYSVLIVDEAHHLEDEATAQLGWRISEWELARRLEQLWSPAVGHGSTGSVPEALAVISTSAGLQLPQELVPVIQDGERAVLELGSRIGQFFDGLARLLEDPERVAGSDETTVRLNAAVRAGSIWQELEGVWADALTRLEALERAVAEVTSYVEAAPAGLEAARSIGNELGAQLDYWHDVRRRLNIAIHTPEASAVYWVAGGSRSRSAWLHAAPLEVASLLRERLFAIPETSILVSATLSVGRSFEYVKRRLGLEDASSAALGSPFDYARAALLYVPNDLPDPTQVGYQRLVEHALLDLIVRLDGRTLVLFTSRAHLRTTYQALRPALVAQHITLLGQGIDESSRTRLLEAFRRGSRVALFGTNAFWEGIDVVGEALSCVVVTRLPFAVPTDPVYAARAEQFEEPFAEYAVPQAVLRLKQGFGRLIRAQSDRGAVVVLDRRLVTRQYGHAFLQSLPPCSVQQGPTARIGVEAANWLSGCSRS
jgi:Rad3-related DNA helicase